MERIAELELMDNPAHAEAYACADFNAPHQRFVELFLQKVPPWCMASTLLDLGCGAADIAIRMAHAIPDAYIDGIDGSPEMLALGQRAIADAGLTSRINLQQVLLPDTHFTRRYPVIYSNSLLHHLKNPDTLWQTLIQVSAVPSFVFIVDLMRPSSMADVAHLVEHYVAAESPLLQQDFHASLCAAYRVEEVQVQIARAGLNGLTCEIISDRHWCVQGIVG
ncbi:MAG: class I SAM-dependent methyltransferase [Pseudomonadota bacterium]